MLRSAVVRSGLVSYWGCGCHCYATTPIPRQPPTPRPPLSSSHSAAAAKRTTAGLDVLRILPKGAQPEARADNCSRQPLLGKPPGVSIGRNQRPQPGQLPTFQQIFSGFSPGSSPVPGGPLPSPPPPPLPPPPPSAPLRPVQVLPPVVLGQGPKEAAPSDPEAAPKKKKKANKRQKALVEADKYWAALAASPPAHDGDDDVDGPPDNVDAKEEPASPISPQTPEMAPIPSAAAPLGTPTAAAAASPPEAMAKPPAAAVATPTTEQEKTLVPRPPVVTIMGHVDHGKTTILDKLRNAHVAEGEVGGITQSIGAFSVQLSEGTVTFVDTPGHEAFKEMRQAGALVTDIIIIVIAASEGIMPQTREVLELAQWQHLPIIIALNKIDLGTSLVDRILRELRDECGLELEPFGGNTQVVKMSAVRGEGLQDLVQAILLEAELAELKAEVDCTAEGVVLESRKDARQGATVSIIVRKGHISVGDWVVAGTQCHRIRGMRDDKGQPVTVAGPSCAVEMLGLKAPLPEPCSKLLVLRDERPARRMARERSELAKEDSREQFYEEVERMRLQRQKEGKHAPKRALTAYGTVDLKAKYQEKFLQRNRDVTPKATIPTFSVILKADVAGTLKALLKMVSELDAGKRVAVDVVKSGVGPVTEQELELARVAQASIVAFNVDNLRTPKGEHEPKVHHFDVIYRAVDFVKQGMAEAIEPVEVTNVLGAADVKQIFVLNGKKSNGRPPVVAGCHVHSGTIQKGKDVQCRVLRHTKVVHVGTIQSLKVHQNETGKVAHGSDCGILLEGDFEPEVGDVVQTISLEKRHCTVAEVFGAG